MRGVRNEMRQCDDAELSVGFGEPECGFGIGVVVQLVGFWHADVGGGEEERTGRRVGCEDTAVDDGAGAGKYA